MNIFTIKEPTPFSGDRIPSIDPLRKRLSEIVQARQLAVEKLTEDQLIEALIQALPDFTKYVSYDGTGQRVTYLPGSEADRLRRELETLKSDLKPIMEYVTTLRYGGSPVPPSDRIITPFLEKHPELSTGL